MQWGLSLFVEEIDVGASFDDGLDDGIVIPAGGEMQRRLAGAVDAIRVGAQLQQQAHRLQMPASRRRMQRRPLVQVQLVHFQAT